MLALLATWAFWERLGIMERLLRGVHEGSPLVKTDQASRLRLRFLSGDPPTYETDGEWNRAKSAVVEIETLPGALRVLAPTG